MGIRTLSFLAIGALLISAPTFGQSQDKRAERQDDPLEGSLIEKLNSATAAITEAFRGSNYVAAFRTMEEHKATFVATPLETHYKQNEACWHSYIADHDRAIAIFEQINDVGILSPHADLAAFDEAVVGPTKAVAAILQESLDRPVIMVNEAHHIAQTRLLTAELLQPLYDRGFRYLATEAYINDTTQELGYPTTSMGYYTDELMFGDLLHRALTIGYELMSYEGHSKPGDDPAHRAQLREQRQAENLQAIFDLDPEARILVHCGYGHLLESNSVRYPYMAEAFAELTGIDPLTVSQTTMLEGSSPAHENLYYRHVTKRYEPREATVFPLEKGGYWIASDRRDAYDMEVFLPRAPLIEGRPLWLWNHFDRHAVLIPEPWIQAHEGIAMVQACLDGEDPTLAVPIDHIMFSEDHDERVILFLPEGDATVRLLDHDGEVLASRPIDSSWRLGRRQR